MEQRYTFRVQTEFEIVDGNFTTKSTDDLEDLRRKAHIHLLKKLGRKWNPFKAFTMKFVISENNTGLEKFNLVVGPNSAKSRFLVRTVWRESQGTILMYVYYDN
jgi:hypothetical protein